MKAVNGFLVTQR